MCHRLEWFIHLRAQDLNKGGEHPPTLRTGYGSDSLPLPLNKHRVTSMTFAAHRKGTLTLRIAFSEVVRLSVPRLVSKQ